MQNISYKFILKQRKNKDDTKALILRITVDRNSLYIFTGIRILEKFYDDKKIIKSSHPYASEYLSILSSDYTDKLSKYISDTVYLKKPILLSEISELFKKTADNPETITFYDYIQKLLDTEGKANLKKSTLRLHKIRLKQMRAYQDPLYIHQITREWLIKFENFLKFEKKNNANTINAKLRFIKTYINKGIRDGLIKDYVFRSYKLKSQPTKPKFLTPPEFEKLEKYFKETKNEFHKKHLQYFLFACCTGLRYSDLYKLKWSDIQEDRIIIRNEKTQAINSIPINNKIRSYLPVIVIPQIPDEDSDEYLRYLYLEAKKRNRRSSEYIFDIPTNQKANEFLKQIATAAGISLNLSCHVARHTFATISLDMNIPLPVVSKLLGHSSFKTTEIYAKIIDKKLDDEMKKWDNI